MKLWEIKAQSLRLMFADTDLNFDKDDFVNEVVYQNPNTREKLVRMEDSIQRAIDLYYQYNGETTRTIERGLVFENEDYKNEIDFLDIDDFGFPTRIDIVGSVSRGFWQRNNIEFMFDQISRRVFFTEFDFKYYEDKIKFLVYYKIKKQNLPKDIDEIEYDLDEMYIPEEVQRQIPLFIKGELYEEDEPSLALAARNEFIGFLVNNQRKNFGKSRSKVKRQFPWGSE